MLYSVNMSPVTGGRGAASSITAKQTGETHICQILVLIWELVAATCLHPPAKREEATEAAAAALRRNLDSD